jgi:hypothetical protein
MSVRERANPDVQERRTAPVPEQASEGSGSYRETGDAFLEAADEAIARALSQNSEAFLAQNRQQGGQ